jgi:hypothetical protein
MSHIVNKALIDYAQLVILATKAYVYNNLVIPMDRGVIMNGVANNKMQEIIDSYSDANVQYDEYYQENWGKVTFMNDRRRMGNLVASMMAKGS